MPRKAKPKRDNPEQFKRFIETVRETGAEEEGKDFDRLLKKVADQERAGNSSSTRRRKGE